MKYQVYFGIALRIIMLFGAGFLMSYINPTISQFLGDEPCLTGKCGGSIFYSDVVWHVPHYWYFWCLFFLFLLSLANCIIGIVNLCNKHYKF